MAEPGDHLLTLLLARRLHVAGAAFRLAAGRYRIVAGAMRAVIEASAEACPRVRVDDGGPADCSVAGGMTTFLGVFTGRLGLVWPVLTGRVRIGGKVWMLLSLLKLAPREAA